MEAGWIVTWGSPSRSMKPLNPAARRVLRILTRLKPESRKALRKDRLVGYPRERCGEYSMCVGAEEKCEDFILVRAAACPSLQPVIPCSPHSREIGAWLTT